MHGFIKKSSVEKLLAEVPLAQVIAAKVELSRSGDHHVAKCPFHADSTPSFHVYASNFHCYGCGAHGDAIHFEMRSSGRSFVEVTEDLASRFGVILERESQDSGLSAKEAARFQDLIYISEESATFFHEQLLRISGVEGRNYLKKRGFDKNMAETWKVGFCGPENSLLKHATKQKWNLELLVELGLLKHGNGGLYDFFRNRIIFPIKNDKGKIVAFGGRVIPGVGDNSVAKYLNSSENPLFSKSKTLFNFHSASAAARQKDRMIIVEGYLDCVTLVKFGFAESVAVLGTALTADHVKLIRRCTTQVFLCFDNDAAGEKAAARSFGSIFPLNLVDIRSVKLQGVKDPDELLVKEGTEGMERSLKESVSLTQRVVNYYLQNHTSPEARLRIVQSEVLPIIRANPDPASVAIAEGLCEKVLGLSHGLLGNSKTYIQKPRVSGAMASGGNSLDSNLGENSSSNSAQNSMATANLNTATKAFIKVMSNEELRLLFVLIYARYMEIPPVLRCALDIDDVVDISELDLRICKGMINEKDDSFFITLREIILLIKNMDSQTISEMSVQLIQEHFQKGISAGTAAFLAIIKSDAETLFKYNLDKWVSVPGEASSTRYPVLLQDNLLDFTNRPMFRFCQKESHACWKAGVIAEELKRLILLMEERFLFNVTGKLLHSKDTQNQFIAIEEQRKARLLLLQQNKI